jgi:hypothetical protein
MAFETQVYPRAFSRGTIHLVNVPINARASQGFLAECLKERYDIVPEAMLGKLFTSGLDFDLIPKI